jgi:hypothetical protein
VSQTRDKESASGEWTDTVAAILLALAAVATAWSSYQASRWTAQQTEDFAAANAARVESTTASDLADTQTEIDVDTFTQWVDAHIQGDVKLADFYEQRFRGEFQPAFHAWLDTDPFNDASAPPSPFAMPEYKLAARQQAEQLQAKADSLASEAKDNVQRATDYVLGVVLFAVALFFAGISTRLARHSLRAFVLIVGIVVFLSAAIWIATFPISLSV